MPSITNILPGKPEPLGPTVTPEGVNFAVYASEATRLEILLFDNVTDPRPSQVIPLDPESHRTDGIWHVFLEGLPNGWIYRNGELVREETTIPAGAEVEGTIMNLIWGGR